MGYNNIFFSNFVVNIILFYSIFLGHYKQIHDIVKDVVLFTKDLNLKPIAYLGLRLNAEIPCGPYSILSILTIPFFQWNDFMRVD